MPDTVAVTIEVEPAAAEALGDPATRARIGRLFDVMDTIADEAHRRGLTDDILEDELAAHNAEHRYTSSAV